MQNAKRLIFIFCFCLCAFYSPAKNKENITRAQKTLEQITAYYRAKQPFLFNENYPNDAKAEVTYLASRDTSVRYKVAYLWPTSGVFSGVNALLKVTNDKKYKAFLNDSIVPGIQKYYDNTRTPFCFQSYLAEAGHSDRYYDDNVWLAIDFLESYHLTGNRQYLDKSIETWKFIISGWSDEQDGGIFWCEQKKGSKNTCSNAPSAVLAMQLFETTKDSLYFNWGEKIYNWNKTKLQDPTDYLYFDNISLAGKIGKAKYTYNSGQMLQAAALLYKITGKETYLTDARNIAKSAIQYFTEDFTTPEGKHIRLFRNRGSWFNAILLRGYTELYARDKNDEYLRIFQDNLDHVWKHARYDKGLFTKDWSGDDNGLKRKWLLDQAAMVEMYAVLGRY
jgi:uncharacterized protein YyaL (SSP411 family)